MSDMRFPLDRPWSDEMLRAILPFPERDAHKYSRGVLTLVAGSKRYPGAACLAARASQRMGAGYTEIVTSANAIKLALSASPSLVAHDVKDWHPIDLATMKKNARRAACVGPGFDPEDPSAEELVFGVLRHANFPVLVDGGGLAALGSGAVRPLLARRRENGWATILTPHAGEAARLADSLYLEAETPEALASTLAQFTGAIVVLKGPDTFIAAERRVYPMREGTPALAKAGTGDVLAGMISALLAQGVDCTGAAVLGATLHARAGAIAAEAFTEIGVTAEDVIDAIPGAIRTLSEGM